MDLAKRFEQFGAKECAEESPLYARLSAAVARDPELLDLASKAPAGQPPPNLLFAAVHYLLLKGDEHALAAFYPSLDGAGGADPAPAFADFCRKRREDIEPILSTRRVQTNEVRRCAPLVMALSRIAAGPMALIDVGASAGLNLLFDKFGYTIGGEPLGDLGAPVQISATVRGPAPRIDAMPTVVQRMGIDVAPLDVRNLDDTIWLRALVWPEDVERASMLARAIWMARQDPPTVLRGEALDVLPSALANVPAGVSPVIFHSAAANQMTAAARAGLAKARAWRISLEWEGTEAPRLELFSPDGVGRLLARVDGHVRWIEWLES